MNETAKKLREVADRMGDGVVNSAPAIIMTCKMFDVRSTTTFGGDLGNVLTVIADELDELYHDLFCGGEFSVRGYGGLAQSLDFWLSDDTGEEHYRDAVARFKAKWMRRTPRNRVEFYEGKIQAYADKCKVELGLKEFEEGE